MADGLCQACQFYVASLWLLPAQFNVLLPSTTLNHTQVTTILKQISYTSGTEVVFKGMSFEMHGLEHEVRAAVSMLLDLDIVKVSVLLLHAIVIHDSKVFADLPSRDPLPDRTCK